MKCLKCFNEIIRQMDDTTLPFTEEILSDTARIRTFDTNYPDHLFKWHWDSEDRLIIPIEETDWQFQFDNELPQKITNKGIFIPKGVYHRLIKGSNKLQLKIETNINKI